VRFCCLERDKRPKIEAISNKSQPTAFAPTVQPRSFAPHAAMMLCLSVQMKKSNSYELDFFICIRRIQHRLRGTRNII
jgi:hypothetical protein